MSREDEDGLFKEKLSKFLKNKLMMLKETEGEDSEQYKAIYLQYKKDPVIEKKSNLEANRRHWEADLNLEQDGHLLKGLERLYSRVMVIEPTIICAAHCRYCLRGNYDSFTLDREDILNIAKYCGSEPVKDDITEVLVTGGDPLIVPKRLDYLVESLIEFAPNVKRIRIGTRLPLQDPDRIESRIRKFLGDTKCLT